MSLKIEIRTANAAFVDNGIGPELRRILRDLENKLEIDEGGAGDFEQAAWGWPLKDYNGQTVGTAKYKPE